MSVAVICMVEVARANCYSTGRGDGFGQYSMAHMVMLSCYGRDSESPTAFHPTNLQVQSLRICTDYDSSRHKTVYSLSVQGGTDGRRIILILLQH